VDRRVTTRQWSTSRSSDAQALTLDDLAREPGRAQGLSAEERARLIVQAAAALAVLGAGFTHRSDEAQAEPPDKLLTAEEAAPIAGLTVRQLKTRRLPFRRKLGHRTLRYSERALRAWLRRAAS
jgi:predicted DNA-binding transcriptional regulator AlpA